MREYSDTQIRILDAAAQAFMASGFDSASIDDVARNIEQTKGVVYYNFRGKMDLFRAVYERGMAELVEVVTAIADRPGSGLERLRAMSVAHVDSIIDRPAYHDVIRQGVERRLQARLTEEQRAELVRLLGYRDRYEDLFLLVIEAGIADGSMRPLPEPRIAARALIGGLNAVNVWLRYRGPAGGNGSGPSAEAVADVLVGGFTPAA